VDQRKYDMSENSKIQWTDHTFNPWIGCTKVAPECKNCYAEELMDRRYHRASWGKDQPRVRTSEANWTLPLRWQKQANASGKRFKVFCASLSDWLDDEVPADWLADLLALIHQTPNLDWLLLTKRPENWGHRVNYAAAFLLAAKSPSGEWAAQWTTGHAPVNVWIGVSAGANLTAAIDIPARIHFLSCEPMLHQLDTMKAVDFNWIIFGGESGRNARPCYMEWLYEGLRFCRGENIAPFVKQLGQNCIAPDAKPYTTIESHGGDMSEWPEDLRVREFPI
jgi:protein gp37